MDINGVVTICKHAVGYLGVRRVNTVTVHTVSSINLLFAIPVDVVEPEIQVIGLQTVLPSVTYIIVNFGFLVTVHTANITNQSLFNAQLHQFMLMLPGRLV